MAGMPMPLSAYLAGERHPYDRGAERSVGVEIVEHEGKLVALAVWDNGDRTPVDWAVSADAEDAWREVLLQDGRTRAEREQALAALEAIKKENDYWAGLED